MGETENIFLSKQLHHLKLKLILFAILSMKSLFLIALNPMVRAKLFVNIFET